MAFSDNDREIYWIHPKNRLVWMSGKLGIHQRAYMTPTGVTSAPSHRILFLLSISFSLFSFSISIFCKCFFFEQSNDREQAKIESISRHGLRAPPSYLTHSSRKSFISKACGLFLKRKLVKIASHSFNPLVPLSGTLHLQVHSILKVHIKYECNQTRGRKEFL